jgi:hypothetical protein
MLTGVQKVISQELKCLNSKTTAVLGESTIPKIMNVPYIFIALEVNKLIVWKCIYTVCTERMYSIGLYVYLWYSHTLYRITLSVP